MTGRRAHRSQPPKATHPPAAPSESCGRWRRCGGRVRGAGRLSRSFLELSSKGITSQHRKWNIILFKMIFGASKAAAGEIPAVVAGYSETSALSDEGATRASRARPELETGPFPDGTGKRAIDDI